MSLSSTSLKISAKEDLSFIYPFPALLLIIPFFLITVLCLLVGAAEILRSLFPILSLLIALFLYFKYPTSYLGFVWWLWFLSPLVRRLIDFEVGWEDPNVVLLSPYLATLVTALDFIQYLPKITALGALPFLLSGVAVIYSLFVGLVTYPADAVVVPLLGWITPITFGFYLFINWQRYVENCRAFQHTFLWGTLVMGGYGVWQFLTAPEWDRFWLTNSEALAFGQPAPLEIRVWSTMHSPGPFSIVIMAGLLMLLANPKAATLPATGLGYLAFLLSQVRAVWLGWIVGILTLITSLRPSFQIRFVIMISVIALLIVPLTNLDPYSEIITSRLESFYDLAGDDSFQDRAGGFGDLIGSAISQILGNGLGFVLQHRSLGANDSGIFTMLFTLGWFGTIFYLSGLALLVFKVFSKSSNHNDPLVNIFRSICLGTIVQFGLGPVMIGIYGVILWGFLGMTLAGQTYYKNIIR